MKPIVTPTPIISSLSNTEGMVLPYSSCPQKNEFHFYLHLHWKLAPVLIVLLLIHLSSNKWTHWAMEPSNPWLLQATANDGWLNMSDKSTTFYAAEETFSLEKKKDLFLYQKQQLITRYLLNNRVSSVEKLPQDARGELEKTIAEKFFNLILEEKNHKKQFFEGKQREILRLALHNQSESNIPASISLAMAAFKTNFGEFTFNNNFFELRKNGKLRSFSQPKDSFRAYAIFLSTHPEYVKLFTGGKDANEWIKKLGQLECQEYSDAGLETKCAEYMQEIIQEFNLDLLDY